MLADQWTTTDHLNCVTSVSQITSPMEAVMEIRDIGTGTVTLEEVFHRRMEMRRVGDRISGITQYSE